MLSEIRRCNQITQTIKSILPLYWVRSDGEWWDEWKRSLWFFTRFTFWSRYVIEMRLVFGWSHLLCGSRFRFCIYIFVCFPSSATFLRPFDSKNLEKKMDGFQKEREFSSHPSPRCSPQYFRTSAAHRLSIFKTACLSLLLLFLSFPLFPTRWNDWVGHPAV